MGERKLGWPYKKEFVCHRCGNCCRGDGYVDITEDDAHRVAGFLEMEVGDFLATYCKPGNSWPRHLIDQEDELQSCVFLTVDEKGLYGCSIHKAKPEQCEGFPFMWRPKNIMKFCEGMRALEGKPPLKDKSKMA